MPTHTHAHCRLRTLVVGERPGTPPLSHLPGLSPASGPARVPASLLDVTSIFSSCTSCLCTAGSKACWVGASPRPALSPPTGGLRRNRLPGAGASQSAEASLATSLAHKPYLPLRVFCDEAGLSGLLGLGEVGASVSVPPQGQRCPGRRAVTSSQGASLWSVFYLGKYFKPRKRRGREEERKLDEA